MVFTFGVQRVAAVCLAFGALFVPAAPAVADTLACAEQSSVLLCDADGDGIVDVVEEAICGSATCATGAEDADGNGIPDAEELAASLRTGGPGGPVQRVSSDSLLLVNPDGTLTSLSLWPFAAVAALLLAGLTVFVVRRHTTRPGMKESLS